MTQDTRTRPGRDRAVRPLAGTVRILGGRLTVRAAIASAASLVVVALLAGCAASTPAPVLLTLPSSAAAEASPTPSAATPVDAATAPLLALQRVEIPEYLVARRVRYRADAATLAEWPNTYWGERIEVGVSREFGVALRRALPGWSFCETNCADRAPAFGLRVEIAPLDYRRADRRLDARARLHLVTGDLQGRPVRSVERGYRIESTADSPQAEAEAIATLVRQVAADAARLVPETPRR